MAERNAGLPSARRIEFRIGIHRGDVVEEPDGDLMGDGVHIGARLEGIAAPGGVCLSEDAYRQSARKAESMRSSISARKVLKNIARPIGVYALKQQKAQRRPPPGPTRRGRRPSPSRSFPSPIWAALIPNRTISSMVLTESLTTDLVSASAASL